MGIGIEQIFGKCAGFFSTNVNPIALDHIGWKFFAIYCGWITFEFLIVFFFYPETHGRTLEELAFCEHPLRIDDCSETLIREQCLRTRSLPTRLLQLSRSRSIRMNHLWRRMRSASKTRCRWLLIIRPLEKTTWSRNRTGLAYFCAVCHNLIFILCRQTNQQFFDPNV